MCESTRKTRRILGGEEHEEEMKSTKAIETLN